MKIINKLSHADYVTLLAILFSWLGVVSLITNNVLMAINLSLLSFLLDLLDGYVARKSKKTSELGPFLDVHADVFIYLIFSCFLLLLYIGSVNWHTLLVSTLVLCFGILRLIRFTQGGIIKEKGKYYYIGFPVYFPYFFVMYSYLLGKLFSLNLSSFVGVGLVFLSFLMVSEVKNIKTRNIVILGFIILSIFGLNIYVHH